VSTSVYTAHKANQSICCGLSPASGPLLGIQELRCRMSSLEATRVPRDATRAGCVIACDSDHMSPAKFALIIVQNLKQRDVARKILGGVPSPLFCGWAAGLTGNRKLAALFFSFPLKSLQYSFQTFAPALSQRRRTSVIFAAGRSTGILFVPDFNGQIPRHALSHRYPFANSVSLVDCADLLRCWSGSDLHAGSAN
jgi:hypothetical protein